MTVATGTLTGTLQDPTGAPLVGAKITAAPQVRGSVLAHGVVVTAGPVSATTDATGHFTLTLTATDDPATTPTGFTYRVTITPPAGSQQWFDPFSISVPTGMTIDLSTAVPTSSSGGSPSTITPQAIGVDSTGTPYLLNTAVQDSTTQPNFKRVVTISAGDSRYAATNDSRITGAVQSSALDSSVATDVTTAGSATQGALDKRYRSAQWVYLSDYQGSGISDTTALLNALAASAGKTLLLEGASLTLQDVIGITNNGVTVDARGATLTLVDDGTGTGRIIRASNCSGFTWRGGTVVQNAASRTGVYGMISLDTVDDFRIEHVKINGGSGTGIWTKQATNGHLIHTRVMNTKADGIQVSRGSHDIVVTAPIISGTGDDGVAVVSVTTEPGSSPVVTYPQIARVAIVDPIVSGQVGAGSGVSFVGPIDCSLTGGLIDHPVSRGVNIIQDTTAGTGTPSDISVTGTRVRNAGTDGFGIGSAADVVLTGCSTVGQAKIGFSLISSTRTHITGGKARGGGDVGVYDNGASSTGNNLIGVDLRGNTSPSAGPVTLTSCITA